MEQMQIIQMGNLVVLFLMYYKMIIIGIQMKRLSLMKMSMKMKNGVYLNDGGRVNAEEWMIRQIRNKL
jgi:hypothetical protein